MCPCSLADLGPQTPEMEKTMNTKMLAAAAVVAGAFALVACGDKDDTENADNADNAGNADNADNAGNACNADNACNACG